MVFEELPLVATWATVVKRAITKSLARTTQTAAKKKKPAKKAAKKPKAKKAKKAKKPKEKEKEEEEAPQEEEGQEGALRRRQEEEGPAQVQVPRCYLQEDRGGGEEEGHWHLQAGDGLGCPLGGHGHQGQDDPRPGVQGAVGAHQEEGPEQGPQRRQDRRDLRRRLDVQAPGRREQAHQVSECVFLSPVISTPGNRGC